MTSLLTVPAGVVFNQTNGTTDNITFPPNHSDCSLHPLYVFRSQYNLIHGYLASFICIAGILGNLANVIVLSRPKMATSPVNFLLMIVAIAEMLLMITYLPQAILFYIIKDNDSEPLYLDTKVKADFLYFCLSFVLICHSVAIWHTIAVAVFRWLTLGITHGKLYSTIKNARICSVVLIVANVCLSIPNWMSNEVYDLMVSDCHFGEPMLVWTVGAVMKYQFNNWLFACFGKILPSILLTILTILLLVIMRKAQLKRQQLLSSGQNEESKRHKEHNRTTGMLLAVVIIFLAIELPHGILIILIKDNVNLFTFYNSIGEIIDIITLVAFSVNFILYTIMSRQFRSTFASLFFKKAHSKPSSSFRKLSTMMTSVKLTANNKRSAALSHSSNTSCHLQEERTTDNHLSPTTPLMDESTQSLSVKSVDETSNT